ncbi:MBL fold metallo-hydrolase [Ilumatobacter nonamiensis]|uniref:MBL fold metallo-hydrolase n=1 Tax=Ilumatobacter nonamiensis TaxID=467093 RepID=UPI00034AAF18|nr:MBL fold metallo-hydrolase [Ilumatobacter nonamiensis]
MQVITVETPSLGDRSYIVHDESVALVIDPQRDIDRIIERATAASVKITHVAETHVHNDYVSGGLTLARVTGARYLHAAAEPLRFDHHGVADGDTVDVGTMTVEVRHTPGHTPHHLTYVVTDGDDAPALFTGGSLLYGTVGRTDLIGPDQIEELTHAQYRSVHALAESLPGESVVYPTHGFGSFCASAASDLESDGTLAGERAVNVALTETDENAFVERLISGLDAFPRYYAQMGPLNVAGGAAIDLSPPAPVDPIELARRIHRGEWVVDLRNRREFAASHVAGTIGVELTTNFSTYLAWLVPWGMPVTLVADDADDIAEAQRQLVRVGIDRPAGAATGGLASWSGDADRSDYAVTDFATLHAVPDPSILDTRRNGEFASGHVAGATHIPLHELLDRLDEVPSGLIHVHCQSGYRASIAASLLDRAGRDVVLVDDSYDNAPDAGFDIVTPDSA